MRCRILNLLPVLSLAVGLMALLASLSGVVGARGLGPQAAMGTAFTYQGLLTDGGNPANGTYDFEFKLYATALDGSPVGSTTRDDVTVTDGRFTVELDFGSSVFTGDARYLEIDVRSGSSTGVYTTLDPRQALTAVPYALYAQSAPLRTVARATGLGPIDGQDNGLISSRILTFTKTKADTAIRVSYTDNLRPVRGGQPAACRWEIRVDHVSCPHGALVYDYYTADPSILRSNTVVGYCEGLGAGTFEIQVWVGPVPDWPASDCYTGWYNSRWVLEAEEVY